MNSTRFHTLALSAVGAAVMILAGCGDESRNIRSSLEAAKKLQSKGDAAGAFIETKTLLQANPKSGEGRMLLASLLADQGEFAAAEAEYRRALEYGLNADLILPGLARAILEQGHSQQVLSEMSNKKLTDAVASAHLKVAIATANAQAGHREKAAAMVAELLATDSSMVEARLLDAKLSAVHGDPDTVLAKLQPITGPDSKSAEALLYLGHVLLHGKNDVAGATAAYNRAIAIQPRLATAYSALIAIAFHNRNQKEASEILAQMRKFLPQHPQARLFEAQLAYLQQNFDRSRDLCQALLRSYPQNVQILQLVGATELQRGALAQAEIHLNKVLNLAPEQLLARRLLAQTYLQMGQPAKALQAIAPAVDLPPERAEILETAAEVYLNLGNASRASELYRRASSLKPNDAGIQTALAMTQFSRGQDQMAFNSLESIAAKDPGTVADLALISALLQKKQFDKAMVAVELLAKKNQKSPIADNLRGRLQLLRGDNTAARISFEAALAKDPKFFAAAASLGDLDFRAGNSAGAIARYESMLKSDPRNTAALISIAQTKLATGTKRQEISAILEQAIKANPLDASARLALVNNWLLANDAKSAVTAAQQAFAAIPGSPEVIDALGRAQLAAGELNQSLATFTKLASALPLSALPHINSAKVQLANSQAEGALVSAKRAVDLEPNSADARRMLITTAAAAKRPAEAIAKARSLQKTYPNESVGFLFEGDCLAEEKKWDAAARAYRAGIGKEKPGKLPIRLHLVLLSDKQKSEADQFASVWLKEHPKDAAFMTYLGDAATTEGNFSLAESIYAQVVRLEPENPLALNNLAFMRLMIKKPGARELAERANQYAPGNGPFLDTLALAYAEDGDLKRAVATGRQAVAAAPLDPNLRLSFARLLASNGDKQEALKQLESLEKLGEKFPLANEVERLKKSIGTPN